MRYCLEEAPSAAPTAPGAVSAAMPAVRPSNSPNGADRPVYGRAAHRIAARHGLALPVASIVAVAAGLGRAA
jgi:hypothetical protein